MGKPKTKSNDGTPADQLDSGKKKRKTSPHGSPKGKKKRRRSRGRERYWIEDCKETRPKSGEPALTVVITRIELKDDHMRQPIAEKPEVSTPTVITEREYIDQLGVGDKQSLENQSTAQQTNPHTPERPERKADAASRENKVETPSTREGNSKPHRYFEGHPLNSFVSIKRAASAKGTPENHPLFSPDYKPLPNGDCGDGIVNPFPKSEVPDKYWAQRRRLFSRFDQGIKLDRESWFSVTPEVIANHIAEKAVQMKRERRKESKGTDFSDMIVLDAFCGCGGNAIAFAKQTEVSLVVCVDTDRSKLSMAAKNASIYGVPCERLVLVEADACSILSSYQRGKNCRDESDSIVTTECHGYKIGGKILIPDQIDTIFLSPPWGGVDYGSIGRRDFDPATCIKVSSGPEDKITNGEDILRMATAALEDDSVIYFLPRNTNGVAVGKCALKAGCGGAVELEQNVVNGKLKTVTAYFGSNNESPSKSPKSDVDD